MNSSSENRNDSISNALFAEGWYNIKSWWPEIAYIYIFALVCNMLVGLPANGWVLWFLVRRGRDTQSSEIFTLSLAVLELAYCLQIPLNLVDYAPEVELPDGITAFFSGLILFGRPQLQCCICVERYLAVVFPITFLRCKPLRYRLGCLAVVWAITFGACTGCVFMNVDILNRVNLTFLLTLLTVMSYCCLAVLWNLRRPGPGEGQLQAAGSQLAKRRAFRIIVGNLIHNLGNYLPLIVAMLLKGSISDRAYYTVSATCFSITVFCAFVQPVDFIFRARKHMKQCIMGTCGSRGTPVSCCPCM